MVHKDIKHRKFLTSTVRFGIDWPKHTDRTPSISKRRYSRGAVKQDPM